MSRKEAIKILEKCGKTVLRCQGNSMRPLMAPGDSLYIKKVDPSKIRVGDAIFCKINGNLQVHRVSAIDSMHDGRWQISNNKNHINGWIGRANIYGLCVGVGDRLLVSEEEIERR